MKSALFFGGLIVTVIAAVFIYRNDLLDRGIHDEIRDGSSQGDTAESRPSWDQDGDGLNDCEKTGTCEEITESLDENSGIDIDPLRAHLLDGVHVTIPDTDTTVLMTEETMTYGDEDDVTAGPYGEIRLGSFVVAYPHDAVDNIVSTLTINTGGSGDFVYLTYFAPEGGELRAHDLFLLGDRVVVQNVKVMGDEVMVVYREHDVGQAMSDVPAKEVIRYFVIQGGKFAQVFK